MGRTRHEIPRLGETGDHPARRTIPLAGSSHAGAHRNPEIHVLSMVRSVSDGWARGTGRSQPSARSGVEPHPRSDSRADRDYLRSIVGEHTHDSKVKTDSG